MSRLLKNTSQKSADELWAMTRLQCIASDDPRLREKELNRHSP